MSYKVANFISSKQPKLEYKPRNAINLRCMMREKKVEALYLPKLHKMHEVQDLK